VLAIVETGDTMDTAMRDMDQLRERGDESTGRKVGLFVMAAVLSVIAVFSLGLIMGRDESAASAPAKDPLAELVGASSSPAQAKAKEPAVGVDALSFPATLLEREDPAVEATVRAAEAEHAALMGTGAAPGSATALLDTPVASLPLPSHASAAKPAPASMIATKDTDRLSRVARHDPLMAQAMPAMAPEVVPQGYEGAYTLQVVSYEDKDQADRFAKALRTRGHKAFVVQADVPGRGRFNRVRIGPFETRKDAVTYQRNFESAEKMHTILVGQDSR
jgi:cell division septation protein DedD